ncbi:unnamed protein product [Cutaneotrichosporon oleaginosum]
MRIVPACPRPDHINLPAPPISWAQIRMDAVDGIAFYAMVQARIAAGGFLLEDAVEYRTFQADLRRAEARARVVEDALAEARAQAEHARRVWAHEDEYCVDEPLDLVACAAALNHLHAERRAWTIARAAEAVYQLIEVMKELEIA